MPKPERETGKQPGEGDYSDATLAWLERTGLPARKASGQYMTPRKVRDALLDRVDLHEGMTVLDPGVGTGEFLASVRDREPTAELAGWDIDETILAVARANVPTARLEHRSALDPPDGRPFDLVIGNPPWFQFRADPEIRQRFAGVISGRPNIFALFFQAAIEAVRPGGQVALVVPPSMNNGAYFEALRAFIVRHGRIEHLELLDGAGLFEDARTAVQLIVIRVGEAGAGFHLRRNCADSGFSRTIFSPRPESIEAEFTGRSTLWQLGFEAATGTVVWNRNRSRLERREGDDTVPLIWAHTIEPGGLVATEARNRPRFIRGGQPLTGPAVVVNRVVGAVGRGTLRAAPVPAGMKFLAENHVNVIRARPGARTGLGWPELAAALNRRETGARARRLTGNTQISARELTHLLPIDMP